tara:strand:- start:2098 stop:2631 length:534 start_codon:yes stop_codon:yes gene_type:complete
MLNKKFFKFNNNYKIIILIILAILIINIFISNLNDGFKLFENFTENLRKEDIPKANELNNKFNNKIIYNNDRIDNHYNNLSDSVRSNIENVKNNILASSDINNDMRIYKQKAELATSDMQESKKRSHSYIDQLNTSENNTQEDMSKIRDNLTYLNDSIKPGLQKLSINQRDRKIDNL